jgi:hypothetical protein
MGGSVEGPRGPVVDETTSRRGLLIGLVLGVPIVAFGVRGVLVDAVDTHPGELTRWLVGAALVNDLLLVPLVLVVGAVGRLLTPPRAWPAVRAGLLVSGVLCLVSWPFLRGWGRDPTNPSLLARDYGLGLLVAQAVVWLVVALIVMRLSAGGTNEPGHRRDGEP